MFNKLDELVNQLLNYLIITDYENFNETYIRFINEFFDLVGLKGIEQNINLIEINRFLEKLDNAYNAQDVMALWDLFRYEYWNIALSA